jgi:hypothetical protein
MQRQSIARAEPKVKSANPIWVGDEAARPAAPMAASSAIIPTILGRSYRRPASAMNLTTFGGDAAWENLDDVRQTDTHESMMRPHGHKTKLRPRPHSGEPTKSAA